MPDDKLEFKYVNPANPWISGIRAIKDAIASIEKTKVNKDDRLREIRFLVSQTALAENQRVRSVDRYVDGLITEGKLDTPELEMIRDILVEVGFALEEYKSSLPINMLDPR